MLKARCNSIFDIPSFLGVACSLHIIAFLFLACCNTTKIALCKTFRNESKRGTCQPWNRFEGRHELCISNVLFPNVFPQSINHDSIFTKPSGQLKAEARKYWRGLVMVFWEVRQSHSDTRRTGAAWEDYSMSSKRDPTNAAAYHWDGNRLALRGAISASLYCLASTPPTTVRYLEPIDNRLPSVAAIIGPSLFLPLSGQVHNVRCYRGFIGNPTQTKPHPLVHIAILTREGKRLPSWK